MVRMKPAVLRRPLACPTVCASSYPQDEGIGAYRLFAICYLNEDYRGKHAFVKSSI
jgi:hypothetical protein